MTDGFLSPRSAVFCLFLLTAALAGIQVETTYADETRAAEVSTSPAAASDKAGTADNGIDRQGADSFIAAVAVKLEAALKQGRDEGLLSDRSYLDALIEAQILPHIDSNTLCRRIFSPRWKEIVAAEKTSLAYQAVFASLKRTYRLALASYNGQRIEIRNTKTKPRYSVVRIFIGTTDKGHVIDLALFRKLDSWRIFDISIDGVMVSKTLNGSLQRVMQSTDLDAVIEAINPQEKS